MGGRSQLQKNVSLTVSIEICRVGSQQVTWTISVTCELRNLCDGIHGTIL